MPQPDPSPSATDVAAKFASARTDVLISSVLLVAAATAPMFGLFVATIALPLAQVGFSGRWLTRLAVFTSILNAPGSLSITSPRGGIGVFEAFELIEVLLLVWITVTSILRATTTSTMGA